MNKPEAYKTLFDDFKLSDLAKSQSATIAHIEMLCAVLDKQDEEFQHLKKQIRELETRIEKMEKSFSGKPEKKRYCFENGVSER